MERTEASLPPQDPGNFFKPLLISLACMIGTCLAIVAYHLLVLKYCLGRRRRRIAEEILTRHNLAAASADGLSPLGVEEEILKMIPVVEYSSTKGNSDFRIDQTECAVCLGELEDGEAVRLLPSCHHAFHVLCIDEWFIVHSSCPLCRSPVVAPVVDQEPVDKPATPAIPGDTGSADSVPSQERLLGARLLRHCMSLVIPPVEAPGLLPGGEAGLKRSFSMIDLFHIVIDIEPEQADQKATASSSSSSSSSQEALLQGSDSDSMRRFDQLSSRLIRSFSQLRIGRTGMRKW